MIKYRITAFLTACSMAAALCSCSMSSENSSSADSRSASSSEESSLSETDEDSSEDTSGFELPDDIPEEYLDVAEVKNSENLKELRSHISAMFDHLDESGNDKVRSFEKTEYSDRANLLYQDITAAIDEMGQSITEQEKRQVLIDILTKLCD